MREKTFQIVYCSRNNILGTATEVRAQVEKILDASRRNNARVGVTGALFYNTIFFAQVLEGSLVDVQEVFERLQLDPRHSDLVVLESGFIAERGFAHWSMAYAGASPEFALPFVDSAGHDAAFQIATLDGERVREFLRDVVVKQESWALPDRPSAIVPMTVAAA